MIHWKQLAAELSKSYNANGVAIMLLQDTSLEGARVYIDMTPEGAGLVVKGRKFKPKAFREWAWTHRRCRSFQRPAAFFWAVYDDVQDQTQIGVGAVTTHNAAQRLQKSILELASG